jgi:hypothetical protein
MANGAARDFLMPRPGRIPANRLHNTMIRGQYMINTIFNLALSHCFSRNSHQLVLRTLSTTPNVIEWSNCVSLSIDANMTDVFTQTSFISFNYVLYHIMVNWYRASAARRRKRACNGPHNSAQTAGKLWWLLAVIIHSKRASMLFILIYVVKHRLSYILAPCI